MTQIGKIQRASVALHYIMLQAEAFKREMKESEVDYQERRIDNIVHECDNVLKLLNDNYKNYVLQHL